MFWLLYNRFTFEELENDEKNVFMPLHIYRRHLAITASSEKKKKNFLIFYTCILEKVSTYHISSAFTQHYYACRVLFVLKPLILYSFQLIIFVSITK